MPGRRFELMSSFLHLKDSQRQLQRDSPEFDKLYNSGQDYSSLQKQLHPHRQISIDESMISFKGMLGWLQYMQKKPIKWGIKAWVLTDSSSGYVWNFHIYTGNHVHVPVRYCRTVRSNRRGISEDLRRKKREV